MINKLKYIIIRSIEFFRRIFSRIRIHNTLETLNKIKESHVSISRFGDFEFELMLGTSGTFQKYQQSLSEKMQLILKNQNSNCLVGIPFAMYSSREFTKKSNRFWISYSFFMKKKIEPYFDKSKDYYDAQISRIYVNRKNKKKSACYFDIWKSIWYGQRVLICEGSLTRFGVKNDLFSSVRSIKRVICPSTNAYDKYEEIFNFIISHKTDFDLVLIALGPTATVLAYDLSLEGIWAIDIGNMDMEYEWSRKGTDVPCAVDGKFTIEANGGDVVNNCDDELYLSQIIGRIC